MKITTLETSNIEDILSVFNSSFSDYSIPLQLNISQLKSKIEVDHVDLSLSVGAFENEKLVGFVLHGTSILNGEKVAYNGGTGVIPEKSVLGCFSQLAKLNTIS